VKENGSGEELTLPSYWETTLQNYCKYQKIIEKMKTHSIFQPSEFKCSPPCIVPAHLLRSKAWSAVCSWALLLSLKRHQLLPLMGQVFVGNFYQLFWVQQRAGHCTACHRFSVSPAGSESLLAGKLCQLGSRGLPATRLMIRLLLACLLLDLPLPPSAGVTLAKWGSPSCSWPKCNSSFIPLKHLQSRNKACQTHQGALWLIGMPFRSRRVPVLGVWFIFSFI